MSKINKGNYKSKKKTLCYQDGVLFSPCRIIIFPRIKCFPSLDYFLFRISVLIFQSLKHKFHVLVLMFQDLERKILQGRETFCSRGKNIFSELENKSRPLSFLFQLKNKDAPSQKIVADLWEGGIPFVHGEKLFVSPHVPIVIFLA